MPASATYLDLLNPDGLRNAAAFAEILARRIAAEINLRLCVAAGLFAPRHLSLGEISAWRREAAAGLDPALVPQAERDAIAAHERAELDQWVRAMQRAGARQRDAMNAAFAQAAE
jgi:hypothetical protein